ncbi:thermonuclease family protein [Cohaesibacter marisflavi]|uniref:thermonuclease family protein n=1 Tax=Cohaesibacter marisflavi TaxID=655353 RepID=UPI0029C8D765|nr:thermonuclease family protein [Cohaesibacter marisflavi]
MRNLGIWAVLSFAVYGLYVMNENQTTPTDHGRVSMPICSSGKRVSCVVDGDTFWLKGTKYRLKDVDTPETNGQCSGEQRLAANATRALSSFLSKGEISLRTYGEGYYGRTLVKVSVDGQDAGKYLLQQRLARRWPDGPKFWCND